MYSPSVRLAWAFAGALSACASNGATRVSVQPAAASQNWASTRFSSDAKANTEARASEVKSTLLAREAVLAMPGFESRLYLIEFPPKVVGLLHTNTEQCVGYVLQGRLEAAFGADPITVMRAGEAFVERPHEAHRLRNPDPKRVLRIVVTGTFRNKEPMAEPLSGAAGFDTHTDSPAPEAMNPEASTPPLTEVKRTLLVHRELADFPGLESRLYLIEFPPAAKSKDHLHTAQGIGYVIDGSFESAFGDGPTTVKRAGDAFIDSPGLPHHFRNPDSTRPLRFLVAGTYHPAEQLFVPTK